MARLKSRLSVVFVSSEVAPFAKTGGLGDVCGTLPLELKKEGVDVSIIMPLYKVIDQKKFGIQENAKGIFSTKMGGNTPVYFIKNDQFFGRDGLYGDRRGDFEDNFYRFLHFCRKSFELMKTLKIKSDIIHCHDWHASLMAPLLRFQYRQQPFYRDMKSILTVHNLAYQGIFQKRDFLQLGLPQNLFGINGFEFYDNINLLKAGILFSDCVTTVSPTYAREIYRDEYGAGLSGVIRSLKKPVVGILNGLDLKAWDPKVDICLPKRYSKENLQDKSVNKKKLQELSGLARRPGVPLFGFVGRLSAQKGLDLMAGALDEIMGLDLQLVFLGLGDDNYVRMLNGFARRYPNKIAFHNRQEESLAHLIYAGSDLFLMPSVYEPCGLGQMISLRYGTIPVVFKTGGLADTIKNFDEPGGNGFLFTHYTKGDFIETMKTASQTYSDKKVFSSLLERSFEHDFSWKTSAQQYVKLYQECLQSD